VQRRTVFAALWRVPILTLSLAVLPVSVGAVTSAGVATQVRSTSPLTPVTKSLPAARSDKSYLATLTAERGTRPYRCAPKSLHVGSLALLPNCEITGTALTVKSESITGPFIFKLTDSSNPPKTIEFPSMNFTVVGKAFTPSSFDGTAERTINAEIGEKGAVRP